MKFVIFRSQLGFGDRLGVLLTFLPYCLKTGRILVVDWTDKTWCNQDVEKDFNYYFDIKNIKYMKVKNFKKFYIEAVKNNINLTCVPYFCKNTILRRSEDDNYSTELGQHIEKVINGKKKDLSEDIVVISGKELRGNRNYKSLENINFNDYVMNFIKKDVNYEFLNNNEYISIHMRGTDRSNNDEYSNNSNKEIEYVKNMINKIPNNEKNILLLSDSKILVETFLNMIDKEKYNILQTNNEKCNTTEGLHYMSIGDKENRNLEMLKDFYLMYKSKFVINDGISYFSNLAKFLCHISK